MPRITDDRGVSTVVGFVLTLGITSLLVVGLLVGVGGFVDDQRRDTVRDEMEVLGQQIAADLAASDRLVRGGGSSVRITRELPSQVTGVAYQITVSSTPSGGGYVTTLELTTEDPDVSVQVSVRTVTAVDTTTTTLNGGDVDVVYTGSQLEVQNG